MEEHIATTSLVVVEQVTEEKKENDEEDKDDGWAVFKADGVEMQFDLKQRLEMLRKEAEAEKEEEEEEDDVERYFIGETCTRQHLSRFLCEQLWPICLSLFKILFMWHDFF